MIRLFAALAVPQEIAEGLERRQHGVSGARWRTADQMHITLRFFGEVDEPTAAEIDALREHSASVLAPVAQRFSALPRPDHVVGSSKAIRSLARLAGYPVPGWSGIDRMVLPRKQLKDWIPRLAQIPAEAREALPGITADRTFQIVAAAVVVHQAMKALDVDELEVSPWALREGVLLRYIEELDGV